MIQFYKPNPKVTGSACSFYLKSDGSLMASMLKQDSWNDQRKTGSFSKNKGHETKSVMVKLSRIEIAGIIDSIESNREWSAYHRSKNQVVQLSFSPYIRGEEDVELGKVTVSNEKTELKGNLTKTQPKQIGFSLSINKQMAEDSTKKGSFIIGFTFPESRLLKHTLEIFLDKTLKIMPQETPLKSVFEDEEQQVKIKEHDLESSPNALDDGDIF